MTPSFSLRRLRSIAAIALVAAPLAAPSSASALLVGAESNSELVNSDRTPTLQAEALDKMRAQGVQVVRGNVGWNEVAGGCEGQSLEALRNHLNPCYQWGVFDSFVSLANQRRMQVVVSVSRAPKWANGSGNEYFMGSSLTAFNKVATHYAAFHKAAAARYKPGAGNGVVKYWTVHNEPNSKFFWAPRPDAARYAKLYGMTAVAIKQSNPRALVAPGPTGPKANQPLNFIREFQRQAPKFLPGAMTTKRRYLNAWAHNPYPNGQSPFGAAPSSDPTTISMQTLDRLFRQLDSSPLTRGAKVWGTEFGWETSGNMRVSQARQAQYIAEGFHLLDMKRRVTFGISYGLTDPTAAADWQSGTYTSDGRPKLSARMFQRMVSVPQAGDAGRVRKGTRVNVWGRANVSLSTGKLVQRKAGTTAWRVVAGQRRKADGSITASVVLRTNTQFAVFSQGNAAAGVPAGYGVLRSVRVS